MNKKEIDNLKKEYDKRSKKFKSIDDCETLEDLKNTLWMLKYELYSPREKKELTKSDEDFVTWEMKNLELPNQQRFTDKQTKALFRKLDMMEDEKFDGSLVRVLFKLILNASRVIVANTLEANKGFEKLEKRLDKLEKKNGLSKK